MVSLPPHQLHPTCSRWKVFFLCLSLQTIPFEERVLWQANLQEKSKESRKRSQIHVVAFTSVRPQLATEQPNHPPFIFLLMELTQHHVLLFYLYGPCRDYFKLSSNYCLYLPYIFLPVFHSWALGLIFDLGCCK